MRFLPLLAAPLLLTAIALQGQSPPPTPLRLIAADGQRAIPTVISGDTELVALDDLAAIFRVQVREDALARAITINYQGRTAVLSQEQAMASIGGRFVANQPLLMAGLLMTSLPPILVLTFLSRYLVSGIAAGMGK